MYDLKTYLRNVYELESSVYQQTQAIQDVEGRIRRLPQTVGREPSFSKLGPVLLILSAVCGFISWFFIQVGTGGGGPAALLGLLGFAMFIPTGWLLFYGGAFFLGSIGDYSTAKKSYANAVASYNNGQIVKRALDAELPGMRSKLSATQSLLREYYGKGILHYKYQNLVAVSYLLDCIDTGRCTQLDGPNGAYNQFELEVRMDRISSQLDTVITKLEQIRQNQFSLYNAITQANRINSQIAQKLDGVCSNLSQLNSNADQIRRSLNVANHTAELTRKEIAYRNYLDRGSSYSY